MARNNLYKRSFIILLYSITSTTISKCRPRRFHSFATVSSFEIQSRSRRSFGILPLGEYSLFYRRIISAIVNPCLAGAGLGGGGGWGVGALGGRATSSSRSLSRSLSLFCSSSRSRSLSRSCNSRSTLDGPGDPILRLYEVRINGGGGGSAPGGFWVTEWPLVPLLLVTVDGFTAGSRSLLIWSWGRWGRADAEVGAAGGCGGPEELWEG